MKCEKCQSEATVHIAKVVNNQKQEHHFCDKCAKKHDTKIEHIFNKYVEPDEVVNVKVTTEKDVVAGMLQQLDDIAAEILGGMKAAQQHVKACPECGMTLQDFMKTGKFRCPRDYEVFEKELGPIIERLQGGATQHLGKVPTKSPIAVKKRIEMLEAEMESAIKKENYERAAQIRDQLKDLQKQ